MYDSLLDKNAWGNCFLSQSEIAEIIVEKLHQFDNDKYLMKAYCIMPNHVHLLIDFSIQIINIDSASFHPQENYWQLFKVMKHIKGATAYQCNQILGRKGKFWLKDSMDRYIRTREELIFASRYIASNPVLAGLATSENEYPYSYSVKL